MDYDDLTKYGIDLTYAEHNLAEVEKRFNTALENYFEDKFNIPLSSAYVCGLKYNKIGGNQKCMFVIISDNIEKYFLIEYSPAEFGERYGVKFNKCRELDGFIPEDKAIIMKCINLRSRLESNKLGF